MSEVKTDLKIDLNNLDKSNWKTYRFDEIAKNISELGSKVTLLSFKTDGLMLCQPSNIIKSIYLNSNSLALTKL